MNILDARFHLEWQDYAKILSRRKWYFLVPFVLVVAAGVFYVVTRKPVYESFCIVQIQPSRTPSQLQGIVPGVRDEQRYVSLRNQILSTEYLTRLIRTLGLDQDEQVHEQALALREKTPNKSLAEIKLILLLKQLREQISVRTFGENNIEIRALASSPERCYSIVNTLQEIFTEEFLHRELVSVQSAMQFSDEQINTFQSKLREAEQRLEAFKRKVLASEPTGVPVDRDAAGRINEALATSDITTKEKREHLNQLNRRLNGIDFGSTFPQSFAVQSSLADITRKLKDEADLMKQFSANSAEIIKINRSINALREIIRKEFENYFAQQYPTHPASTRDLLVEKALTLVDLQIAQRKKEALRQVLQSAKYRTSLTQSQELELKRLEEEVSINRKIYNILLEQAQGTQIEEAMQRANAASRINIIEPPLKPLEPTNAGYRLIALVTLIVATGLGLGAVYLREFFDSTLRTVEEVEEYFELPVLCVLPYLEENQIKNQNQSLARKESVDLL